MLSSVAGGRFLRMAGSDEFQHKLNRSAQPVGGDFTHNSAEGSGMVRTADFRDRNNNGTDDRDEGRDSIPRNPGNNYGPGKDFSKPPAPQRPGKPSGQGTSFNPAPNRPSKPSGPGTRYGSAPEPETRTQVEPRRNMSYTSSGEFDPAGVANKYVQNAARTNPINVEALDKSIRSRPLYHEAKGKLEDLNTFGDMYRYGREELPEWRQPAPMEGVESPDFEGMYDKTKKDLDDYKV